MYELFSAYRIADDVIRYGKNSSKIYKARIVTAASPYSLLKMEMK